MNMSQDKVHEPLYSIRVENFLSRRIIMFSVMNLYHAGRSLIRQLVKWVGN